MLRRSATGSSVALAGVPTDAYPIPTLDGESAAPVLTLLGLATMATLAVLILNGKLELPDFSSPSGGAAACGLRTALIKSPRAAGFLLDLQY